LIKYYEAPDVKCMIKGIVELLRSDFEHIDIDRIWCYRSKGSKSTAYARIHGLPRIWIKALKIKPGYVIEVISENYDELSIEEKIMILLHELLHIPKTFSGGLRPHGKYVNKRIVKKLFSKFVELGGIEFLLNNLKCNQW